MRTLHQIRCALAGALIALGAGAADGLPAAVAPTVAEVVFNTRPLVKARLQLPESLRGYEVTRITRELDDPSRFEVEVRFRARTPFGAITEHSAQFRMKRSSSGRLWIVTAD